MQVPGIEHSDAHPCSYRHSTLHWPRYLLDIHRDNAHDPIICFLRSFPFNRIDNYCDIINGRLTSKHFKHRINRGLFLRYLGIRLTMAVLPNHGGVDQAFSTTKRDEQSVFEPGFYTNKYGMSKNIFKMITSNFELCQYNDADVATVSFFILFCHFTPFLYQFNMYFSCRILGYRLGHLYKILTISERNTYNHATLL